MYICYNKPAEYNYSGWEKQALPLGNGKIGAKIFGGVQCELIQFNEKTLWSGGPGVDGYSHGISNPDCGKALKEVQELLLNGKTEAAAEKMSRLEGNETAFGAYQSFGNIYINFNEKVHCSENTYLRDLDFSTGSCMVACQKGTEGQNRHYFISYPDNVFVGKITATGDEMLDFTVILQSEQNGKTVYDGDFAFLDGTVQANIGDGGEPGKDANGLRYGCALKVIPDNGKIETDENGIRVYDCFSAVVIMSCATNYSLNYPLYRKDTDPLEESKKYVLSACAFTFSQLFKRHLADYKALMCRTELNIGQSESNYTTDGILKLYKKGKNRREAESLLFDYGRYLLISSSRNGSLPANLQGIWNSINNPPWNSDYHLNINLQMNYFPALTANLAETVLPLIDFAESLRKPGRYVANKTAGIGENRPDGSPDTDKSTGWVAHTQVSPFGMVGPGSDYHWGWAAANGAFLMHNLYEYFEFTGDISTLREKIYPVMEESALFFTKYLIKDEKSGRYLTVPSLSPEHGPLSYGTAYDQTIIFALFSNVISCAEKLEESGFGDAVNSDTIEKIKELLPHLRPIEISKKGQIKEWLSLGEISPLAYKRLGIDKHHRHISQLLGLYPLNVIKDEAELQAAEKTLNSRGTDGPGWSQVLKIAEYARLGKGEECYKLIEKFISSNVYPNLFANHPPFQIDANFGYTAAVCEMLMQSHKGYIELLPALPQQWPLGSVKGLCARNGFEVGFEWKDGKFKKGTVKSLLGETCRLYYKGKYIGVSDGDGNDIEAEFENGTVSFKTEKGKTYTIF